MLLPDSVAPFWEGQKIRDGLAMRANPSRHLSSRPVSVVCLVELACLNVDCSWLLAKQFEDPFCHLSRHQSQCCL